MKTSKMTGGDFFALCGFIVMIAMFVTFIIVNS